MKRSFLAPTQLGIAGTVAVLALMTACSDWKSASGFCLPDGGINAGREAFIRLNCHQCHTVAGEKLPGPDPTVIAVPLGGEVLRVKTYGQLVTSIINPQHIINPNYRVKYTDAAGRTLMPDYNGTMTVNDMINLVAYLQSRYKLKPPEPAYPMHQ